MDDYGWLFVHRSGSDCYSIAPHHIIKNVCFNYAPCEIRAMPGLLMPNDMLLEAIIETVRDSRGTNESIEYSCMDFLESCYYRQSCVFILDGIVFLTVA